ncbi:MAG: hypothetical protein WA876_14020, partial [Candidatus Acidiferrales bacterium]
SLMRMLGPHGNPQARNLFEIVKFLQETEGVQFEVRPRRAASRVKRRQQLDKRDFIKVNAAR